SKKLVGFIDPSALITFILPSLSATKSLSSPACLTFTGFERPFAKGSKEMSWAKVKDVKQQVIRSVMFFIVLRS
ncbi:MAG: hypothetical protein ACI9YE_003879, partial [Psychroserpens sp.]